MNRQEIEKEIQKLRKEREQYAFPQKRYFRINGRIGALRKKLKPNYIEKQRKAQLAGVKARRKNSRALLNNS